MFIAVCYYYYYYYYDYYYSYSYEPSYRTLLFYYFLANYILQGSHLLPKCSYCLPEFLDASPTETVDQLTLL